MHFDAFFREMSRAAAGVRANEATLPRQAIVSPAARLIMLNGSPTRSSSIQNQGRDRTVRLENPLSGADAS